jgi:two-component system, sensor histidine kinase PdtaS
LRRSLEEKIALLKEVHHRVKNNLQIVASLLDLQSNRTHDLNALLVLQDTRNRVRSMALLHEVLYRSGNFARINFVIYVDELCRQLIGSFGASASRVKLINIVSDVTMPLEQSVPCGLIINELVSNALKHGFPNERAGTITVELYLSEEKMLVLRVSDNGVGLPPEINPADTSKLGLKLVSNLADQLKGRLIIDRANTGCIFSIVFPIPANFESEGRL